MGGFWNGWNCCFFLFFLTRKIHFARVMKITFWIFSLNEVWMLFESICLWLIYDWLDRVNIKEILSTSIYDLVLIYVCHFHHHFFLLRVTFPQFRTLSRYSCCHLGSLHSRNFFETILVKKIIKFSHLFFCSKKSRKN